MTDSLSVSRCNELAPAFKLLLSRPTQLLLLGAETYPTSRPVPPSTTSAGASSGRTTDHHVGGGGGVSYIDRDRELAVEGPTDMGVLVYQMVQQQTQLK